MTLSNDQLIEKLARLEAENQELFKNLERYNFIITTSNIIIWEYNCESGHLWCSPLYFKMLGYNHNEFNKFSKNNISNLKEIWGNLVHADDRAGVLNHFNNYISGSNLHAKVYENTYRMVCKDGKWIWIYSRGKFLPGHDGRSTGIISGTLNDITEQKENELALRKTKDVIWTTDMGLNMTYVSPSVEEQQGYTMEEMLELPLSERFSDKSIEILMKRYEEEMNKEKDCREDKNRTIRIEVEAYKKDKSLYWAEFLLSFLRDENGVPVGFQGVTRDITARKKAEEKLALAYQQLDEEINKAREIHHRTLPVILPVAEGISMGVYYQPATIIGGDSYNVIRTQDKIVFYLSDITGHGLDGAMLSFFVKEAIESYISLKPDDIGPNRIINHLSRQYLQKNYTPEHFICLFMGVIDLKTMVLTYASAGFHIPPLVKTSNGNNDELVCNGIFISNIMGDEISGYDEYVIPLPSGTTISISTDGLPEQNNGSESFYDYYKKAFYESSHLPPDDIIKAINNEFCLFNNNSMIGDDDITLFILQV